MSDGETAVPPARKALISVTASLQAGKTPRER
jgi:hypothetical protein